MTRETKHTGEQIVNLPTVRLRSRGAMSQCWMLRLGSECGRAGRSAMVKDRFLTPHDKAMRQVGCDDSLNRKVKKE